MMTVLAGARVSGFSRFGGGHESAAVKESSISSGTSRDDAHTARLR